MNQRGPETTENVMRIEAERPAWMDRESVAQPVPPTAGLAGDTGDADVSAAGDETDELREEIAETRTELSETLAAIEVKLNPQHLMAQAKDTVQETTEHVVAQAKHAAHEAVVDAVDHTKEAVHDATIGKVEHMVSNVTDAAKTLVGGATGTARADTETAYYGADTRSTPPSSGTAVTVQPSSGVGASVWETLKENPLPTALAAASLGWLFAHRANQAKSMRASRMSDAAYPQPVAPGQDTVRVTSESPSLSDKAGQVASQVGSTVGDTAETIQDKAGQVASQVGSTVGQVGSTVGSTVGQVGSTVGQVADQAGQAASGLVEGTQQQAVRAQSQFQRVLQENPLAVGVAGLALGAAIGLAIPETQRENQVLGDARDRMMDRALGTAQDTMQKVGTIAQKAESAAEDAVKDEAHAQGLTP